MSGGGGKGGSTTQSTETPRWLENASRDAVERGMAVGDMGYTPYMGPEVAAFNPAQEAAFNNNAAMAADLGLSVPDRPSMPGAQDFGNGIFGYGSYDGFMDTMDRFRQERPDQAAYLDSFFIDPVTGEFGENTFRNITSRNAGAQFGGAGGTFNPRTGMVEIRGLNDEDTRSLVDRGNDRSLEGLLGDVTGIGVQKQGPNPDGSAGYGGGFSDFFDGGGLGATGGSFQGAGLLSAAANLATGRGRGRR